MYQAKDYHTEMLEPRTKEEVYVAHITDPENFYIQLRRMEDQLDKVTATLDSLYKGKAPDHRVWLLGDPCAAQYEGSWGRGRVTGTPHNKEQVEVTFVDFGNKDYVKKNEVFPLPPEMLDVPVMSFHCCLEGVTSPVNFWSQEKIEQFEAVAMDRELTVHIVSYDELQDVYRVLLYDENIELINKQFQERMGSELAGVNKPVMAKPPKNIPARGIARALGVGIPSQRRRDGGLPLSSLELKVGEKTNVTIAYVSSPSEWWCNLTMYADKCDHMTGFMAKVYSDMGPTDNILQHNLRPGNLCVVSSQDDGIWYRGSIVKLMGPKASVFYLDYGHTDTVAVADIKELLDQFREVPGQAIRCSLHGVVPASGTWTDQASDMFEKLVMEKEYMATVVKKDASGIYYLSLIDSADKSDVAAAFVKLCSEASHSNTQISELPSYPRLNIQMNNKAEVFLSWVNTPGDFYVQVTDNESALESLSDNLQAFYGSSHAKPVMNVTEGAILAARYSGDNDWYRAVVKGVTETSCDVLFIDYGNSDTVEISTLKQLEKQFSSLPAQAVHCSLAGVRPLTQGSTWTGDAPQFLETLAEKGALCTFLSRSGDTYDVRLEAEGKNIADEMISLAVVRESTPDVPAPKFQTYQLVRPAWGKSHQAYVSFAESVENFHIQLANNMVALEQLMNEMQAFYETGKRKLISNLTVGMPCAAKYEEDNLWYRAQVRSFTSRDVDVFFVDYGNTQSSARSAIFHMEQGFITKLEAQAVHCRLDINESRNSEAQLEIFSSFTDDQMLELVLKNAEGSKLTVDLLKEGMSLTEKMKGGHIMDPKGGQTAQGNLEKPGSGYTLGKVSPGQTVSAFASFIESPSHFWVQLAGCDDELTSMMETLSNHYGSETEAPLTNPTPGQPCVALYDEDEKWYRALVMSIHGSEIKVQFVDYGNTDLVDRKNIKPISAVFMSSPLLAVECCLDGFQSCPLSDEAVEIMESLVSDQELAITFRGTKNVVVKAGDKDVAQILQEKGIGSRLPKSSPRINSQTSQVQSDFGSSSHSPDLKSPGFSSNNSSLKFKEAVPPSGSAAAIITHVDERSGLFYVQLLSSESQLQQLSSKLQSLYGSGGPPLQGAAVQGMACCAKYSLDNCWYRALVEKLAGGKVQVQFVDYGNSDLVHMNNLKSITADLIASPVHAFPCKLKGLKSWTAQTCQTFNQSAMDVQLNVRFVTSSSPFEIQASINGQDLLQMMFKHQTSSPSPVFESRSNSRDSRRTGHQQASLQSSGRFNERSQQHSFGHSKGTTESWEEMESPAKVPSLKSVPVEDKSVKQVFQSQQAPAGVEAAYVSCVAEDGTFYLQLVRDIDDIDEMTTKVQQCPQRRHPSPRVGAACGAQYSEDDAWYRGIIKSVSGSSAQITFVDFGNGETCEINSLKPLPTHLLSPPLAYQCQVEGIGLLTTEQQEAFSLESGDKEYLVSFKDGVPFDVIIKDSENSVNLADTIFKPTGFRSPAVPTEMVQAVVSQVGQDGHFYLQLNKDMEALVEFADEMQTVCEKQLEKLDSFEKGQICCARFSEDGAWYRASILSTSGDRVTVFFVDYGNTDTVGKEDLLVVPASLMAKPAFIFHCRIPGVKKWKESQQQKFVVMTDGKIMNARFLSSKPPFEVELTRNIGLELQEDESIDESAEKEKSVEELTQEVNSTENRKAVEEECLEEAAEEEGTVKEHAGKLKEAMENVQEERENTEDNMNSVEEVENVQEEGEDTEDNVKTVEASTNGHQELAVSEEMPAEGFVEPAETTMSEEEFSDAKEEPEDSTPADSQSPSAAAIPEFPVQVPPALDACVVSHMNSDGTFYLQLLSDEDCRDRLTDKLQDECESGNCKMVESPTPKLACCAKFSEDEAWYRSTIEKVDGNMVEVLFVDFGNTDSIPVADLRELSAESLRMPPLAYKCVLEDCDLNLVSSKLEDVTTDQTLTVTFSSTDMIPYSVNLQLENGINVSTLFLTSATEEEVAGTVQGVTGSAQDRRHVVLEQGQRLMAIVSHVVSPSLFYMQCEESLAQLEQLADTMYEHFSSLAEGDGVIDNLTVNQLCACQFGEDEAWCRAVVKNINSEADTCDLVYVDYGNSGTVPRSSVRELLAEFKVLPWQCVSCSLAGVQCQDDDWSKDINTAFEDLVASKSLLADVFSGDGVNEPYLVCLLDLGQLVADRLLALNLPGVKARVSPTPSVKQIFSDTTTDNSATDTTTDNSATADKSSAADLDNPCLDNPSQDVVESGLDEDKNVETDNVDDFDESEQEFSRHLQACTAQETVDDFDESEQEFSRQLKACPSNMESTMMEEIRSARQNANSTALEEPLATSGQVEKGKEEEEEDEDFEDAVEAEQDSAEEDGNVSNEQQVACSCVSDGLAELDWLDVHVCVAVSASEFWCQLPSARSILASTTLGIQRGRGVDKVKKVKVGHLYLVCDPPQANYRGKVLSDSDDSGRVLVLKLDYGAEERVPTSCLLPLAKNQLELPAQAFCCCLDDGETVAATPEWLNDLITRGEAVDSELQVKVVGRKADRTLLVDVRLKPSGEPCEADVKQSSGESLGHQTEGDVKSAEPVMGSEASIETLEFSQPVLQSTILGDTLSQSRMEKSNGDRDFIFANLEDSKEYEVTVASGGRPDRFYVTELSTKGMLDALADDIEAEVKDKPDSAADGEVLAVNTPCLVFDDDLSQWFRGQVKSADDKYKVLCVDRGVVLEVDETCVRELPTRLLDTATLAVGCCLADVIPVDNQWCDSALTLFTDIISSGSLKLTSSGICGEHSLYKVTLHDDSQSDGDATSSPVGMESSVNRTLVELGYAEAVPSSPLDVELQVERTINDPDKIEQLETSFTEVSCLRENSLGDESDVDDNTEQDRDAIGASGDATKMATESDEELNLPHTPSADTRHHDLHLETTDGGDTEEPTIASEGMMDNSSNASVYTTPHQEDSGVDRRNVVSIEGGGASSVVSLPCLIEAESTQEEENKTDRSNPALPQVKGLVQYVVGAESGDESNDDEETVEDYVSAADSSASMDIFPDNVDVTSDTVEMNPDTLDVCIDDDVSHNDDILHVDNACPDVDVNPSDEKVDADDVYPEAVGTLVTETDNAQVCGIGGEEVATFSSEDEDRGWVPSLGGKDENTIDTNRQTKEGDDVDMNEERAEVERGHREGIDIQIQVEKRKDEKEGNREEERGVEVGKEKGEKDRGIEEIKVEEEKERMDEKDQNLLEEDSNQKAGQERKQENITVEEETEDDKFWNIENREDQKDWSIEEKRELEENQKQQNEGDRKHKDKQNTPAEEEREDEKIFSGEDRELEDDQIKQTEREREDEGDQNFQIQGKIKQEDGNTHAEKEKLEDEHEKKDSEGEKEDEGDTNTEAEGSKYDEDICMYREREHEGGNQGEEQEDEDGRMKQREVGIGQKEDRKLQKEKVREHEEDRIRLGEGERELAEDSKIKLERERENEEDTNVEKERQPDDGHKQIVSHTQEGQETEERFEYKEVKQLQKLTEKLSEGNKSQQFNTEAETMVEDVMMVTGNEILEVTRDDVLEEVGSPDKASESPEETSEFSHKVSVSVGKVAVSESKASLSMESPDECLESLLKTSVSLEEFSVSPKTLELKEVSVSSEEALLSPDRASVSPKKALESLNRASETPGQAFASPEKASESPEKTSESPEKVSESPKKASESPEKKASESSEKTSESPEKKASESPEKKTSESPEKTSESPEKKASESLEKKASESSEKTSESPEKKASESPEKTSESPEKNTSESPEKKASESPEKASESPEKASESSEKASESPEKTSGSPEKKASELPEKKASESLEKKASESPEKASESPEKKASELSEKTSESPEKKTSESPEKKTSELPEKKASVSPEKKASESPEKKASESEKTSESPEKTSGSPEKKASELPEKKASESPEKKASESEKTSGSPEKKASESPEKKTSESPEKKASGLLEKKTSESPEKTSESPEKTSESPEKTSESPEKKTSESPEKASELPEKASELPEKASESPEKKASESPEKTSESPEKKASESSEKKASESSEKKASESPEKTSESPEKKISGLPEKKTSESPKKKTSGLPEKTSGLPEKTSGSPEKKTSESPEKKASGSPEKASGSPEKKATEPPEKKASESPEKASETPEKALESPEKASESPEKALVSTEKTLESPGKASESPQKASESPQKASVSPDQTVVSPPDQASVLPEKVSVQREKASESPDKVVMRCSEENMSAILTPEMPNSAHMTKSVGDDDAWPMEAGNMSHRKVDGGVAGSGGVAEPTMSVFGSLLSLMASEALLHPPNSTAGEDRSTEIGECDRGIREWDGSYPQAPPATPLFPYGSTGDGESSVANFEMGEWIGSCVQAFCTMSSLSELEVNSGHDESGVEVKDSRPVPSACRESGHMGLSSPQCSESLAVNLSDDAAPLSTDLPCAKLVHIMVDESKNASSDIVLRKWSVSNIEGSTDAPHANGRNLVEEYGNPDIRDHSDKVQDLKTDKEVPDSQESAGHLLPELMELPLSPPEQFADFPPVSDSRVSQTGQLPEGLEGGSGSEDVQQSTVVKDSKNQADMDRVTVQEDSEKEMSSDDVFEDCVDDQGGEELADQLAFGISDDVTDSNILDEEKFSQQNITKTCLEEAIPETAKKADEYVYMTGSEDGKDIHEQVTEPLDSQSCVYKDLDRVSFHQNEAAIAIQPSEQDGDSKHESYTYSGSKIQPSKKGGDWEAVKKMEEKKWDQMKGKEEVQIKIDNTEEKEEQWDEMKTDMHSLVHQFSDAEESSCDIIPRHLMSSRPATSKSECLLSEGARGDQESAMWKVNPMDCPLPSSSSDESTRESLFSQERQETASQSDETVSVVLSDVQVASAGVWEDHSPAVVSHMMSSSHCDPVSLVGGPPFAHEGFPQIGKNKAQGVEENHGMQDPESTSSSSICGDGMDPILTSDEMEEVAAQLETMAVQEMQKHHEEEKEDHREELAHMIEDYGSTIEVEGKDDSSSMELKGEEKDYDTTTKVEDDEMMYGINQTGKTVPADKLDSPAMSGEVGTVTHSASLFGSQRLEDNTVSPVEETAAEIDTLTTISDKNQTQQNTSRTTQRDGVEEDWFGSEVGSKEHETSSLCAVVSEYSDIGVMSHPDSGEGADSVSTLAENMAEKVAVSSCGLSEEHDTVLLAHSSDGIEETTHSSPPTASQITESGDGTEQIIELRPAAALTRVGSSDDTEENEISPGKDPCE